MSYQYKCYIKPSDLWVLSMYRTYHSLAGMCNLVFGASMFILAAAFWEQAGSVIQALLFLAVLLVPLIHPAGVYLRARAQAAAAAQGTELIFAEDGIHAVLNGRKEVIRWRRVKGVQKQAGMLIIFTGAGCGYMLTGRVLGNEKDELYQYVKAHIKDSKRGHGRYL